MSELSEKERNAAIASAVRRSFDGLQIEELQTPEEAGLSAADYAFKKALEREKTRSERKRRRKNSG